MGIDSGYCHSTYYHISLNVNTFLSLTALIAKFNITK